MKLTRIELISLLSLISLGSPAVTQADQAIVQVDQRMAKFEIVQILNTLDNHSQDAEVLKKLIIGGKLTYDPATGHYILNTDITDLLNKKRVEQLDATKSVICTGNETDVRTK
ncbi:hypothetical protein [Bdellovibrio reynosensis]|uniref:Uncharacterized protein n=1 Tax=Bdellovibrio reynosensis TaxID=2835041 RepID=A0ABY4C6C0_9BACT|nr:hypothetical protein [Bdellovibrio reynosensis]UOF00423.1 hypothetical protein MNR06_12015 [Bdellovibrio reynosensis]